MSAPAELHELRGHKEVQVLVLAVISDQVYVLFEALLDEFATLTGTCAPSHRDSHQTALRCTFDLFAAQGRGDEQELLGLLADRDFSAKLTSEVEHVDWWAVLLQGDGATLGPVDRPELFDQFRQLLPLIPGAIPAKAEGHLWVPLPLCDGWHDAVDARLASITHERIWEAVDCLHLAEVLGRQSMHGALGAIRTACRRERQYARCKGMLTSEGLLSSSVNRQLLLSLLRRIPGVYRHASIPARSDRELALLAVRSCVSNFEFVQGDLRHDKDVCLALADAIWKGSVADGICSVPSFFTDQEFEKILVVLQQHVERSQDTRHLYGCHVRQCSGGACCKLLMLADPEILSKEPFAWFTRLAMRALSEMHLDLGSALLLHKGEVVFYGCATTLKEILSAHFGLIMSGSVLSIM
eukprot:CAMPEP_0178451204 /NCGR_PEP_ID=MMETSP0689_2-20121128/43550_1 /TAXON_ID=160604 /ORGANISM="Amphidinium massartii, Strain CS-259" /LENGTH=410 /DNA_ID=CAMNT_0020076755 /DNA_START=41 /DNA_END=1274 /DNA_ORIENTATION=+